MLQKFKSQERKVDTIEVTKTDLSDFSLRMLLNRELCCQRLKKKVIV